jgi:hypothetical protein
MSQQKNFGIIDLATIFLVGTLALAAVIIVNFSTQPLTQTVTDAACPVGQWECNQNCADQETQLLFNQVWCNGEAQWMLEAGCGGPGGAPRRVDDPTCGGTGGGNPTPTSSPPSSCSSVGGSCIGLNVCLVNGGQNANYPGCSTGTVCCVFGNPIPTATPIPPTPVPNRYSCNGSNGNCYANPNGPFTSLTTCNAVCEPPQPTSVPPTITPTPIRYACNTTMGNCYPSNNGPYINLAACSNDCFRIVPTSTPNPTPSPTEIPDNPYCIAGTYECLTEGEQEFQMYCYNPYLPPSINECEYGCVDGRCQGPQPTPEPFCNRTCIGNFICAPNIYGGTCVPANETGGSLACNHPSINGACMSLGQCQAVSGQVHDDGVCGTASVCCITTDNPVCRPYSTRCIETENGAMVEVCNSEGTGFGDISYSCQEGQSCSQDGKSCDFNELSECEEVLGGICTPFPSECETVVNFLQCPSGSTCATGCPGQIPTPTPTTPVPYTGQPTPYPTVTTCFSGMDPIPPDYVPPLVSNYGVLMHSDIVEAVNCFMSTAIPDLDAYIAYGYRSYESQSELLQTCMENLNTTNPNDCNGAVGYPGCSEHQTGYAVDIFGKTWNEAENKWELVSISPILNEAYACGLTSSVSGDTPHLLGPGFNY